MNKKTIALLIIFTLISLFLHLFKMNKVPPCINSDEAAFGYNAYSLLETGRDEHGISLPARLLSFGENKLPLMGYLSIPFIKLMGLNELSTRMIAILIGVASPILLYFLAKEVLRNEIAALISAFLISVSPWTGTISRHAHEAVLAYFFITLSFIYFFKFIIKPGTRLLVIFSVLNGLALFSHHIAKPFSILFFVYLIFFSFKKRFSFKKVFIYICLFLLPIVGFIVAEFTSPTNRVNNLLFLNSIGFSQTVSELTTEHSQRIIHNKLTQSAIYLVNRYLSYLSPSFLSVTGDYDPKFGFGGISPINIVEYFFLLVGIYYLFKNKFNHRYILFFTLLIAPLTAATTWLDLSLTRSFYLIVPIILISSYGVSNLYHSLRKQKLSYIYFVTLTLTYLIFLFYSWEFYFNHYPHRALVIRAWGCGYKELTSYIKNSYSKFDKFYITRENGQPYIFLLYYLNYPPKKYQKQASLSKPDKYGFGQVEKFDKFIFRIPDSYIEKKTTYIGYPHDFANIDPSKIKKIKVGTEEIFWIYENSM